jgi:hypothetical protein
MTKQYYECHITMEGDPKVIRPLVERTKWKFSAIHDDIILGEGLKCYATRHFNVRKDESLVLMMLRSTADSLEANGVKVIRRKVERVLYDDRIDKPGSCNGACVGCHLEDYEKLSINEIGIGAGKEANPEGIIVYFHAFKQHLKRHLDGRK